jgi:hypothetical protein
VFHSEYLGNHYEFLLIPDTFSFEVIEIKITLPPTKSYLDTQSFHKRNFDISIKNPYNTGVWQDYETIFSRKKYADSVTEAYYANRLALAEYLDSIKRQATCLVFREIRP